MKKAMPEKLLKINLILIILIGMILSGCGKQGGTYLGGTRTVQIGKVSKERLTEELENFEYSTSVLIRQTSQELQQLNAELGTRRSDVIRDLRITQTFQDMYDNEDPMVSLLEIWGFTLRLKDYYETGYGRQLFMEHQKIVIDAAEKLKTEIENIGRGVLSEKEFEDTSRAMQSFARRNPINETFSNLLIYATQARPGESSPFQDVLSIPLSPITAMKGVDRTATSISGVKDSVKHMADVVENLPESTRWQLLLLLADMENTEIVNSFLTSASTFSQSSVRLTDILEYLPENIHEEVSIVFDEIDDKQANLQTTLDKTQEALAAADQVMAQVEKTVASFQTTAAEVNQAATAWDSAANSTQQALSEFSKLKPAHKDTPTESRFKISDIQYIVETLNQTAGKIQNLTVDLRNLAESEQVTGYALIPERLTNLLVLRLGQLVVMIFVLALVYRVVVIKINKRKV